MTARRFALPGADAPRGGRPARQALPSSIHRELVESLFGTLVSFVAGIFGGVVGVVVAWLRTRQPIFIGFALVLAAFSGLRLAIFLLHGRASAAQRARRARLWEAVYGIGAVGFMLTVGLMAAAFYAVAHDAVSRVFADTIVLGCVGALAPRNAARPAIVYGQVLGLGGPLALVLLASSDGWERAVAALFLLIIASVVSTTRFLNGVLVTALLSGHDARIQKLRLTNALENMSHGLCMCDEHGRITVVNRRLSEAFGLSEAPVGVPIADLTLQLTASGLLSEADGEKFVQAWRGALQGRSDIEPFDCRLNDRILELGCEPDSGEGLIIVARDVTEERLAACRIAHLAHFDALTGLPNREQFHERLQARVATATEDEPLALLSVDLDRFKEVNDTLGHAVGDQLLCMAADRLRQAAPFVEMVARFGGDEFQLLMSRGVTPMTANLIARKLIDDLSRDYTIDGRLLSIGATIGVAYAPQDGATAAEVLSCADMALYAAKEQARGSCSAFTPELVAALRRRREIAEHLRGAIEAETVQVHYQPIVDIRSGRVVACEALARLPHPEQGWISPAEFIPVAEEYGLISGLGELVLKTACRDAVDWPQDVRVTVNFSPKQFTLNRPVAEQIAAVLAEVGLEPWRLEVEITESTLLESGSAIQQLDTISKGGVKVCLDDFGTGYSSLSYLRTIPADKIKIDQSFARDIWSKKSQAVIRSVQALANLLDVELVVEGVETHAQMEALAGWGVSLIQGYLVGRPCPRDELTAAGLLQGRLAVAPTLVVQAA